MSQMEARRKARTLFPGWNRRMRAKWVLARRRVPDLPRVAISSRWNLRYTP